MGRNTEIIIEKMEQMLQCTKFHMDLNFSQNQIIQSKKANVS